MRGKASQEPADSIEARATPGILYVVATPIGNLEDVTYRAVRVLKEADLIACEDTRQTRKLLDHYGIATPVVSYHEHNEAERAEHLSRKLKDGLDVAQVSDAGMPCISDPGYYLIEQAIAQGIRVVPIPGASALVSALVGSGLPTETFAFFGFLPSKAGQRRTALEGLQQVRQTVIIYEAPHRIRETLADIATVLGPDRPVVIARELTKIHEEFIRGSARDLADRFSVQDVKGEITLLIGAGGAPKPSAESVKTGNLLARLRDLMQDRKLEEKQALKVIAKELGLPKSEVYRELQRARGRRG